MCERYNELLFGVLSYKYKCLCRVNDYQKILTVRKISPHLVYQDCHYGKETNLKSRRLFSRSSFMSSLLLSWSVLPNCSERESDQRRNAKAFIKIPSGKFRLVASSVGFETYVNLVDPRTLPKDFTISLKPKADELQGFSVLPPEPDGWKKWGKLFTDIFIGNTPKSNDCKLTNPEVIKFRMNADNTLTAYASEPLQIVNYALGYEIRYKLEEFQYDFNIKQVSYSGYALFTDMGIKHPNRVRRYEEERLETYKGSLMHFKRAFFSNDLDVQGFEMRNLGNISNPEKDRAKRLFSQHKDSVILDTVSSVAYTDPNELNPNRRYCNLIQ